MEDRGLDLDEALAVQGSPEAGDDLVANPECATGLFVDDQIRVPLPKTSVDVGQPVPLVGHRSNSLGQQLDTFDLDAQLAFARGHDTAFSTQPVTEVELAERGEAVVA